MNTTYKLAADIAAFIENYEFYDFRDAYENMDAAIQDNVNMLETCPEHIYKYFEEYYNEPDYMPVAGDIMNRIKAETHTESINNLAYDIAAFCDDFDPYSFSDAYESIEDAAIDNAELLITEPKTLYEYFKDNYELAPADFPYHMPAIVNIMSRIEAVINERKKHEG